MTKQVDDDTSTTDDETTTTEADTATNEVEKWKALARKHERQAIANARKITELEGRDQSDAEKLSAAVARADKAEATLLRYEVGGEKGLTPAQARRLVGATREELEADAEELVKTFRPAGDDKPDATGDGGDPKPPPSRRPVPDLRGGADPTDQSSDTTSDLRSAIGAIPRS